MTSWEKNPALGAGAFREMREQQRHLPLLSSKSEFRADVTTLSHEPQAAKQGRTADSSGSVAGAFATISAARSPARLIMTPWPGKMPPLGAESAVVKPVLRQDSRRLSSGLISSAALRQGVVPGRSCGPREIVWACGMLPVTGRWGANRTRCAWGALRRGAGPARESGEQSQVKRQRPA